MFKNANFGKSGWGIVIFCFMIFWLYTGMCNDGTNLVAPLVAEKMAIPPGNVLSAISIAGVIGVIGFILIGQLNRRTTAKYTGAICMALLGIGYIIVGNTTSLGLYILGYALMTTGAISGAYIAGGSLTATWFPKKKGMVMGFTTMGCNAASLAYVPILALLIGAMGLSKAVFVPACGCFAVAIVSILFVKNTPFERNQYPDNVTKEVYESEYFDQDNVADDGGWTVKKLFGKKEFWIAAIAPGLLQLTSTCVMSQLVVRNVSFGFSQAQAIAIMSAIAVIGLVGSWFWGVVDTKLGTRRAMMIFPIVYAIGLLINFLEIPGIYIVSLVIFGTSIGGSANFTTSLPSSVFGRVGFDKVNSVLFPIQGLVTVLAFLVNGIMLNLTGNVKYSYLVLIVICIVVVLMVTFINEHKYNRDFHKDLVI